MRSSCCIMGSPKSSALIADRKPSKQQIIKSRFSRVDHNYVGAEPGNIAGHQPSWHGRSNCINCRHSNYTCTSGCQLCVLLRTTVIIRLTIIKCFKLLNISWPLEYRSVNLNPWSP